MKKSYEEKIKVFISFIIISPNSKTAEWRYIFLKGDKIRDNTEYWQRYNEHKTQLKNEIALFVLQKKSDQERLRDIFNSIFDSNGFILFRLFRLISALLVKFRIDRQEQQLRELQQLHKQLKRNAKTVCDMSKSTAQALKSEDFEQIYKTLHYGKILLKRFLWALRTI